MCFACRKTSPTLRRWGSILPRRGPPLCYAVNSNDRVMNDTDDKKGQSVGGRPNLAGDEVLAHRLVTRVNAKDIKGIEQDFKVWKSGRAGRIADYLREVILNRHSPRELGTGGSETDRLVEMTQTLHAIRQHLKHMDTNYNQIARRINSIEHTGKLYYEVQASKGIIDKLLPLIGEVDKLVKAQTEAFFEK